MAKNYRNFRTLTLSSAQTIGHRVKCYTWLESVYNALSENHLDAYNFLGQLL